MVQTKEGAKIDEGMFAITLTKIHTPPWVYSTKAGSYSH